MRLRDFGFLIALAASACGSDDSTTSPGGTGGGGGAGGDVGCGECFRAVRCVNACGQTPVSVGCCGCAPPAFDDMVCSRDAAADGAADGAADAAPESGASDASKGEPGDCGECLRAIRCVTACGQTPVSIGCCACVAPAFDEYVCALDAAAGG